MKQKITKQKALNAFAVDVTTLEVLVTKLKVLFDEPRWSIDIDLGDRKFSFESFEELKLYAELPARVIDFLIYINQGSDKYILIQSTGGSGGDARILTTSNSEAWCVGAIETAVSFLKNHRAWYWFIRGWPLMGIIIAISVALGNLLPDAVGWKEKNTEVAAAIAISIALSVVFIKQEKFLPSGTLKVKTVESFISRYSTELTLLTSVLGLLIALLSFLSKK